MTELPTVDISPSVQYAVERMEDAECLDLAGRHALAEMLRRRALEVLRAADYSGRHR